MGFNTIIFTKASISKPAFARAKRIDSPSRRGTKGEDFSTSLTKACSDYASEWTRVQKWGYASEWTRDPRRGRLHTN